MYKHNKYAKKNWIWTKKKILKKIVQYGFKFEIMDSLGHLNQETFWVALAVYVQV